LQLATVNYLLSEPDKSMSATLRLRGDEVSAIVSDRYAPLDAEELMDAVRHALVQHHAVQDVRVRSVATGLVDLLRLTFPAEQQAIKVGDISAIGLDISSSSFGRSAVHVRGLVWRIVCTLCRALHKVHYAELILMRTSTVGARSSRFPRSPSKSGSSA